MMGPPEKEEGPPLEIESSITMTLSFVPSEEDLEPWSPLGTSICNAAVEALLGEDATEEDKM